MTFELDVDASSLFRDVEADLPRLVADLLRRAAGAAAQGAALAVAAAMKAQPHYAALAKGTSLAAEFGLEGDERDSVVDAVAAAVRVEVLPAGPGYAGAIEAAAFREDFTDALAASAGGYLSARHGLPVFWAEWFLTGNGKEVVATHFLARKRVKNSPGRAEERVLMLPNSKTRPEYQTYGPGDSRRGFWGDDDADLVGTPNDNWLTRAAAAAGPLVLAELERAVRAEAGG